MQNFITFTTIIMVIYDALSVFQKPDEAVAVKDVVEEGGGGTGGQGGGGPTLRWK